MGCQESDPLQQAQPGAPTADKLNTLLPEISVLSSEHEALVRSASQDSMSSNIPSYMHTPAEPYEEQGSLSTLTGSKSLLAAAVLNSQATSSRVQETSLDAAVTSLQSIVSGAVMVPASVWYLVSHQWYSAWQESVTGMIPAGVGPIDNSPIADDDGELLPGLKLGAELEAVPEAAWLRMVEMYGLCGQNMAIRRVVVMQDECSVDGSRTARAMLDLYPPSVFVAPKEALDSPSHNESTHRIGISLGASLAELKLQIASVFGLDSTDNGSSITLFRPLRSSSQDTDSEVSQLATGLSEAELLPPSYEAAMSRNAPADSALHARAAITSGGLEEIVADDSTLLMAAGILPDSTVGFALPLAAACSAIFDPLTATIPPEQLSLCQPGGASSIVLPWRATVDRSPEISDSSSDLGANAAAGLAADDTHSVVLARPASNVHYLCGLNNLGNTCFMNSALQCLGHFSDLTRYFVSHVYTHELNRDNPLGMKGAVASAYGRLVNEMWEIGRGAYAPRAFKQTIAQWAPQFRGYNQQDAPEFLAFLLDGLHEDLNRIVHKPYIEVPDADGRPDVEVANEQWGIYKRRNDSVVVDLFQGQYRSTLVCPVCSHTSVTFDPFMYLTLPLPVQRQKWLDLVFTPVNTEVYATRMRLLVLKDESIKQLKQMVAHLTGSAADSLLVCDLASVRIYSIYNDDDSLADISSTDAVHIYELGVDAAKVAADPASASSAVVQLACSKPATSSYGGYSYGPDVFSKPLLLTLPEEGKLTMAALYLRIAEALSRWATVDISPLVVQLKANAAGEPGEYPLLELLSHAATISVHRAGPVAKGATQRRSLTSMSSYMYSGRRGHGGAANAFRAFEDRLTNDNCEPLVNIGSETADDLPAVTTTAITAYGSAYRPSYSGHVPMAGRVTTLASREVGGRRRRVRPLDDTDDYSTKWDSLSSSSDNDTDRAVHGTPKRARSDVGSDSETKDSSATTSLAFVSATESAVNLGPAEVDGVPTEEDSGSEPNDMLVSASSSKCDISPATVSFELEEKDVSGDITLGDDLDADAAPSTTMSLAELLATTVKLDTGDTLLCEWSEKGTQALLAALHSGDAPHVHQTSLLFDFERADEYTMPALDDVTKYSTLEQIGSVAIDELPRVAAAKSPSKRAQRKITLEECLAEFTRAEKLGEDDPWFCGKCKEHQQATKKFDLWRVPEILVVHLKRFQHSRAWRDKLDAFVDFPLEGLDLTQTVVGPNGGELVYDLHSVCNHYGGLGGGHYTAYARNPEDDTWYDFNDSSVSKVFGPESIKTAAAYMLFYRLRSSSASAMAESKIDDLVNKYKDVCVPAEVPVSQLAGDVAMMSPVSTHMMDDSDNERGGLLSHASGLAVLGPVGLESPGSSTGHVSEMDMDPPAENNYDDADGNGWP
ncbi:hypothetical protein GGH93_006217 [Coemansia aciculifera]|nr:hypothetical protein GGH93_006217 [Coemansia aciculifera]